MFALKQFAEKGAGLVALVDIQPGELLISEPSILRVTLINGDLSPGAGKDVSRQFSSMESMERSKIMNLSNNYPSISNDVLGIFKTNAMTISDDEAALFPWVCRANHSCHPNCNYYHNHDFSLQQMFAVSLIKAGEELTVSYLPDNFIADRETRRKFLMKNHNFLCQCSICSLEGLDLENDEKLKIIARRRVDEINQLAESIPAKIGNSKLKEKYKYSCLNLLNQLETMNIPVPTIYLVKSSLFSIYVLCAQRDAATIWSQDLARISQILSGEDSQETKDWRNTCAWIHDYFENLDQLEETVKTWSLII